ncbi:MAG: flagellar biosynthesis protein FlhB [Clostridiales bacterium]|nr:flagellar biosynthesis protein FlhB [Clostridiales bacterium]
MPEGNKTEKATPKKRRDERKKGNVFKSQDAVAVAGLLTTFATLWLLTGAFTDQLGGFMALCLTTVGEEPREVAGLAGELEVQGIMVILKTVGIVAAVAILAAVAATFAQTRFLVSTESMKPKFSRLNPLEGFKRLFSLKSLVETLKNLIKIAILMVIIFLSIRDMFLESSRYLYTDLTVAVAHLVQMAGGMVMRICIAFVAVAALDFFYQWWDYERQMKMTKQEVKEEYKQMEGDPQVKGKIKEIQRRRAQQRMMQQVPGSDVVIRNPTHFAVALRYKPDEDDAPIVLAKGQDNIAMRIVEIAQENKIAVVENVPLARALYAQTELNQMIPPDLYGPVAEVLVYIFRLNEKKQIVK